MNHFQPYWTVPLSPIAEYGKDTKLPEHGDIVIIGSGITGTSVAKYLLENDLSLYWKREALAQVPLQGVFSARPEHANIEYTVGMAERLQ